MKQKYVMPTIEIVGSLLENTILAGSNGGGTGGQGSDPEAPIENPGGNTGGNKPSYPGGSSSKEHNFNAWESWDEY